MNNSKKEICISRIFRINSVSFSIYIYIYILRFITCNKSIHKCEYHDAEWKIDYPHPDTEIHPLKTIRERINILDYRSTWLSNQTIVEEI